MANNYVLFSEEWAFQTPEAVELFDKLARVVCVLAAQDWDGESEPEEDVYNPDDLAGMRAFLALPEEDRKMIISAAEGGSFEWGTDNRRPTTVWIYSEEGGNLDAAATVGQVTLGTVGDHDTVLTACSADTCSRPRAGEFGGGWVAFSADDFDGGHTYDAARRAAAAIKAKRSAS